MSPEGIVNKVAESGIITLDLEELIPERTKSFLDIKDQLFNGFVLKEKDFRKWIKETDWSVYTEHNVAVFCSVDAIVPTWAYMLLSSAIKQVGAEAFYIYPDGLSALVVERALTTLDISDFTDKRVVIKGCGNREIDNHAYVFLTSRLVFVVKSLMYGEPCSTVPVYKKR